LDVIDRYLIKKMLRTKYVYGIVRNITLNAWKIFHLKFSTRKHDFDSFYFSNV
jgi:hypothetical protein